MKIDYLERTLDEKILENETQRMSIEKKSRALFSKTPSKTVVPKENFGLSEDQLEVLSKYGSVFTKLYIISFTELSRCLGHYSDQDEFNEKDGGMKPMDKTSLALLVKAIRNGLTDFTLKVCFKNFLEKCFKIQYGAGSKEFIVGDAKLTFSNEKIESKDETLKWIYRLSLNLGGKILKFQM